MKIFNQIGRKSIGWGFSVAFALLLPSCDSEKLLNPAPETAITGANAFETPERVLGLVNGIYKSAKGGNFYGGNYYTYSEVRGEEFINRTSNTFTAFEAWNHTLNASSNFIAGFWATGYETINNANILIKGIGEHPGVVSEALAKQYVAEAKFVRALTYFALVTAYARPYNEDQGASKGLPLRLQAETTTANNDLKRSTVAEIYAQIIKDLDEAESDLPLNYSTALLNTTRAHRNTAIALKTRVYLNSGKYAKVIEEAKKVVSSAPPFAAATGVKHQLGSIVEIFTTNYTSTESILSVPMTELDNVTGQTSFPYVGQCQLGIQPQPGRHLGRCRVAYCRPPAHVRTHGIGCAVLTKYAKPSPFLDYLPILRYSEILLNYAEAAARTGDLPTAAALLRAVRTRSDASYEFPKEATGTQQALVATILNERRIELLGEGLRSIDILRTLAPFPAKSGNGLVAPEVVLHRRTTYSHYPIQRS
jgi:hypothetical protein